MKPNFRRYFLNFIGILLFAAITIITIIIARGNRIDLKTGEVIETGTIRITSRPEKLTAFINEQPKNIIENRIEGLDPGTYKLRLQQDDYNSWEGEVEVKPGFISDVAVTLFPTDQKLQKVTQSNIDQVFYDSGRSSVIYTVTNTPKGSDLGIWRLAIQDNITNANNAPRKISNFNALTDFIVKGDYQAQLSPTGEKLIIADKALTKMYLLNTDKYNEPSIENQIKLDYPVNSFQFLDNNTIIFAANNLLISYSIDGQVSTLLYYHPTNPPIYTLISPLFYWLNPAGDSIFSRSATSTKQIKLENIKLPSSISQIVVAGSGDTVILQAGDSIFYIEISNSYLHEFKGYKLVTASPNGQFILASYGEEVFVIDTSSSEVLNDINHSINKTSVAKDELLDVKIVWSFDSSFFVFRDKLGVLASYDSRGSNRVILIGNENNRIGSQHYTLNSKNTSLLAIIQDGLTDNTRFNLYKLDF